MLWVFHEKTLVLLLSLGTGLVSHQAHADLSGVFELAVLGKDLKEQQEDTQSFTLIRVAPLYEQANLESS